MFWGDDCVEKLLSFLETLEEPYLIYAHNGGKFDYMYFVEQLENPIKIINGRIAKANFKHHELRDSYSIIPIPLGAFKKDDIDYAKMERHCRVKHKDEIVSYLKSDCIYLHQLVKAFIDRFGVRLTVGGTAMHELSQVHEIERTGQAFDEIFREFYYGGRVQCFSEGITEGKFQVIDVNSMYPDAMKRYLHPTGQDFIDVSDPIINSKGELEGHEGEPYFAIIIADNDECLPFRTKEGLNFKQKFGEFYATSHEIKMGLKYKKLKIRKILHAYAFLDSIKFDAYVDKWNLEKVSAKAVWKSACVEENGKVIRVIDQFNYDKGKTDELFAKFMLNSAYGKFGQNPDNFFDYFILHNGESIPNDWYELDENWELTKLKYELYEQHDKLEIWRKPSVLKMFYNVSIAASITGAARATLFEAICQAENPLYCDTDSLITTGSLGKIKLHDSELGAWKLEAKGDRLAIAGKKMYALMDGSKCVKMASKGIKASHTDIFNMCKGQIIEWESDAPNFKLNFDAKKARLNNQTELAGAKFIKRNIRKLPQGTA